MEYIYFIHHHLSDAGEREREKKYEKISEGDSTES